jgi:hypothetical protein
LGQPAGGPFAKIGEKGNHGVGAVAVVGSGEPVTRSVGEVVWEHADVEGCRFWGLRKSCIHRRWLVTAMAVKAEELTVEDRRGGRRCRGCGWRAPGWRCGPRVGDNEVDPWQGAGGDGEEPVAEEESGGGCFGALRWRKKVM